jgi:molybdate transport system substrate-binding protein
VFWLRWAAALALCGGGCGTPAQRPKVLRVAAASDLQQVLPRLVAAFKGADAVSLTFGASGQLAEQIKAGAPFDLFLAANRKFVDDLAAQGLVRPDSVRPYAQGTLVLVVHRETKAAVETLADLKNADVKKIALANPALAPYGAAGKQALERAGLWPEVGPKVVMSESVRQALQFVQSGNAEAGLVGRAIADVPEVRVVAIDPKLHDPLIQALGIVASTRSAAAEAFSAFILGPEGQKILTDSGFKAPSP